MSDTTARDLMSAALARVGVLEDENQRLEEVLARNEEVSESNEGWLARVRGLEQEIKRAHIKLRLTRLHANKAFEALNKLTMGGGGAVGRAKDSICDAKAQSYTTMMVLDVEGKCACKICLSGRPTPTECNHS